MRRSKAIPAKMVKNYRKVSQRRMTEHADEAITEEAEMARLRGLLAAPVTGDDDDDNNDDSTVKRLQTPSGDDADAENPYDHILDSDAWEGGDYGDESNPLILPSKRPAKNPRASRIGLSKEEVKQEKKARKANARKLQQLETRVASKVRRADLYDKLAASAVALPQALLQSSATLGKQQTKRQRLQRILHKERAGLALTDSEKADLYQDRPTVDDSEAPPMPFPLATVDDEERPSKRSKGEANTMEDESLDHAANMDVSTTDPSTSQTPTQQPTTTLSLAAQMMASVTQLSQATAGNGPAPPTSTEDSLNRLSSVAQEKRYIPSDPTILQTAASLGMAAARLPASRLKIKAIERPAHLQEARAALPVGSMEFEVMDAVRTADVTIVCGETGSGKSTQIPQFLYEAGLTQNAVEDGQEHYQIAITQPRRVAAVSTAKRVSFEMCCGDGYAIPAKNNLVAYQTRYETAGLGPATHIKFMTDGILLQEIQSDLLLRKYSVIVLDEAHERNLNTDVLIGLLSVALPLRKQAVAEENGLVPLRVIIMSATLRVEDFTQNEKLFAWTTPSVVRIPGRTFPVTIHHAKTTELDDYEGVALKKICKIHRKLPAGGILVFLTGKQEIARMVKKLERLLNPKHEVRNKSTDVVVVKNDGEVLRDMDDEEIDGDIFKGALEGEEDDFDEMENGEELVPVAPPADEDDPGIPRKVVVLPLYSLLSTDDQAKIFRPVPENHRLIVVATNIAETSITIPGISYVVDTGRQKCRNYDSGTGVASYDVMWISKAAADQRAGRAGRTGPGQCYRLYSSSLYARQMDSFAMPEVLTRPLEDVVLAMKAMRISNTANFPFPTPPDRGQLGAATRLLADLACLDTSNATDETSDGEITKLGAAVAQLPLGVRYGKMVLVAAEAGVLDYAIATVSALSQNSPFTTTTTEVEENDEENDADEQPEEEVAKSKRKGFWAHRGGDVLATVLAIGAFTHVGRNAGGAAQRLAFSRFCEQQGLNPIIMTRIHDMRIRLTRVMQNRLGGATVNKDAFHSLPPPTKLQERLLTQAIASGLLDHVATLAPAGTLTNNDHPLNLRSAYLGATTDSQEPLFLDRQSVLYTGDSRLLPQWICYDSLVRKTSKSGQTIVTMKGATALDPTWLGTLAKGSRLLQLSTPLASPVPIYRTDDDAILCSVTTKFGRHGWEIAPVRIPWPIAFGSNSAHRRTHRTLTAEDEYAWFARFLLEGRILFEFDALRPMLRQEAAALTNRKVRPKSIQTLLLALETADVSSKASLVQMWGTRGPRCLWAAVQPLLRPERVQEAEQLWLATARAHLATSSNHR